MRTVQAEVDSYKMMDGSDEFAIPKLEIWCNVYNVRMAEKQMRKQSARAVLFNETKGLWKKVRTPFWGSKHLPVSAICVVFVLFLPACACALWTARFIHR